MLAEWLRRSSNALVSGDDRRRMLLDKIDLCVSRFSEDDLSYTASKHSPSPWEMADIWTIVRGWTMQQILPIPPPTKEVFLQGLITILFLAAITESYCLLPILPAF